ncbi:Pheophorbide a oxygenase family protein [Heracleum sosnowskyi]|uniref:Pheophorbide a oxygenase family protein n=1 Tax=Heracleum sosnowskyi TaxID=360622 RepID=A0AAD8N5X6_9APIA|nr:Pheophorbide a oxygenase family protein [Heracleum sosnowskyi]
MAMNLAAASFTSWPVCRPRTTTNHRLYHHQHNTHKPNISLLHHQHSILSLPHRTTTRAATTVDSSVPLQQEQPSSKKYYFVVANAKFMLDEEEHFQEQLAERVRLFEERNMEQDFWLVIEPKFLDKFPKITSRLKRPAVALVSTNGPWITFMKLRLDRVLCDSFEADSVDEALTSNPAKLQFEKPETWVAPYPKYESGWWESFLYANSEKQVA